MAGEDQAKIQEAHGNELGWCHIGLNIVDLIPLAELETGTYALEKEVCINLLGL